MVYNTLIQNLYILQNDHHGKPHYSVGNIVNNIVLCMVTDGNWRNDLLGQNPQWLSIEFGIKSTLHLGPWSGGLPSPIPSAAWDTCTIVTIHHLWEGTGKETQGSTCPDLHGFGACSLVLVFDSYAFTSLCIEDVEGLSFVAWGSVHVDQICVCTLNTENEWKMLIY